MKTFDIHILAADKPFYEGPCESLIVPTIRGQRGIWAFHSNMISAIVPGKMTYRVPGGEDETAFVSSGLIEVEDNHVILLIDSVERPEEIDENRARLAEDAAKEEILQKRSMQEYQLAQARLARATNRLRVKGHSDIHTKL
jgi:F-type H+-transporting ATPase subunit epsilon